MSILTAESRQAANSSGHAVDVKLNLPPVLRKSRQKEEVTSKSPKISADSILEALSTARAPLSPADLAERLALQSDDDHVDIQRAGRGTGAGRPAGAQPRGPAAHRCARQPALRAGAGPPRRLRFPDPRRRRAGPLAVRARDEQGAARRPRAGTDHRHRPPRSPRGRDRRGHRAPDQQAGRPPPERARRDDRRPRGPADQARHPGPARRRPDGRARAGGRRRDPAAAAALRAARRSRDRGARRDRRPGHGDRDRGAQVRRAARVSGGDARAGASAAR